MINYNLVILTPNCLLKLTYPIKYHQKTLENTMNPSPNTLQSIHQPILVQWYSYYILIIDQEILLYHITVPRRYIIIRMVNQTYKFLPLLLLVILCPLCLSKLVFEDNFDFLDFSKWRHDLTLSGGGNWEFQVYDNNRSTTFVKDSILNIKPVLT